MLRCSLLPQGQVMPDGVLKGPCHSAELSRPYREQSNILHGSEHVCSSVPSAPRLAQATLPTGQWKLRKGARRWTCHAGVSDAVAKQKERIWALKRDLSAATKENVSLRQQLDQVKGKGLQRCQTGME